MQFTHKKNRSLYIPYAGPVLLEFPLLNKGSAFSLEERSNFNLLGLLPEVVETIEEQAERAWIQYQGFKTEIDKHIYLRNIQDTNETLFYRLIGNHLEEMMPVIYTPTVGAACERFSEIYRRARGVFISYQNRHNLDDILQNVPNHNVKVIVVTDGERILGLGDQGIGGMGIPIGKLSLYTTCGGISPAYTLPIVLDVGTNNQQLLDDPLYMGWRHPRITDDEYYQFVDDVIQAIKARWPDVLLQFEDFAQKNAMPLLNRYRNEICSFNDDIQGTAAVTVGTLIAASRGAGSQLSEQKIVFLGAGSAGCVLANRLFALPAATASSTWCIVALSSPSSTVGHSLDRKRASDVPPVVDSSGTMPVRSVTAAETSVESGPGSVRNASPETRPVTVAVGACAWTRARMRSVSASPCCSSASSASTTFTPSSDS